MLVREQNKGIEASWSPESQGQDFAAMEAVQVEGREPIEDGVLLVGEESLQSSDGESQRIESLLWQVEEPTSVSSSLGMVPMQGMERSVTEETAALSAFLAMLEGEANPSQEIKQSRGAQSREELSGALELHPESQGHWRSHEHPESQENLESQGHRGSQNHRGTLELHGEGQGHRGSDLPAFDASASSTRSSAQDMALTGSVPGNTSEDHISYPLSLGTAGESKPSPGASEVQRLPAHLPSGLRTQGRERRQRPDLSQTLRSLLRGKMGSTVKGTVKSEVGSSEECGSPGNATAVSEGAPPVIENGILARIRSEVLHSRASKLEVGSFSEQAGLSSGEMTASPSPLQKRGPDASLLPWQKGEEPLLAPAPEQDAVLLNLHASGSQSQLGLLDTLRGLFPEENLAVGIRQLVRARKASYGQGEESLGAIIQQQQEKQQHQQQQLLQPQQRLLQPQQRQRWQRQQEERRHLEQQEQEEPILENGDSGKFVDLPDQTLRSSDKSPGADIRLVQSNRKPPCSHRRTDSENVSEELILHRRSRCKASILKQGQLVDAAPPFLLRFASPVDVAERFPPGLTGRHHSAVLERALLLLARSLELGDFNSVMSSFHTLQQGTHPLGTPMQRVAFHLTTALVKRLQGPGNVEEENTVFEVSAERGLELAAFMHSEPSFVFTTTCLIHGVLDAAEGQANLHFVDFGLWGGIWPGIIQRLDRSPNGRTRRITFTAVPSPPGYPPCAGPVLSLMDFKKEIASACNAEGFELEFFAVISAPENLRVHAFPWIEPDSTVIVNLPFRLSCLLDSPGFESPCDQLLMTILRLKPRAVLHFDWDCNLQDASLVAQVKEAMRYGFRNFMSLESSASRESWARRALEAMGVAHQVSMAFSGQGPANKVTRWESMEQVASRMLRLGFKPRSMSRRYKQALHDWLRSSSSPGIVLQEHPWGGARLSWESSGMESFYGEDIPSSGPVFVASAWTASLQRS